MKQHDPHLRSMQRLQYRRPHVSPESRMVEQRIFSRVLVFLHWWQNVGWAANFLIAFPSWYSSASPAFSLPLSISFSFSFPFPFPTPVFTWVLPASFPFPFPLPAPFWPLSGEAEPSGNPPSSSPKRLTSRVCRIASARSVKRRARLPSTSTAGKSFDSAGNCRWSRLESGASPPWSRSDSDSDSDCNA